jgi:hypothetical protein
VQNDLHKMGTGMDDRLRASDADRDRAALQLHVHFAAGRLTHGELDDRLTMALAARTLGDLRRALADLPGPVPGQHADRLEGGYRRLLALYPARHRRVHEDQMLAVLLTGAPEAKRRPGLADATDLIAGALRVWCQLSRAGMARRGWRGVLALAGAGAVLGLLAGVAFAAFNPPLPTSYALVQLRPNWGTVSLNPPRPDESWTQFDAHLRLGIENTRLVLERAAKAIRPPMSLQALQSQIQINTHPYCGQDPPPVCPEVVITAQATRPTQADRAARVVAHSYMAYVGGYDRLMTWPASVVSGTTVRAHALETGELGALCGALIGVSGAIALGRPDRRFSGPARWN